MGIEVASLYATLEANVLPLDAALAAADAQLKGVAGQAGVTTDVVAGLGAGASTAAGGVDALGGAAGATATTVTGLAAGVEEATVAEDALVVSTAAATESELTLSGAMDAVKGASVPLIGELAVLGIAAMALKGVYDATVGSAVTLSQETRTLGFEIGSTAEQSGKLIFAAESVGVSADTLSRSLNIAIRALQSSKSLGIDPNIEGLGKLSDMYLALEPGVDRDAFLLHEFGRTGAAMAPLMDLGSAGIKNLGDQATATGNVLSGPALDKVHEYDLWVKKLGEDAKGAAVQIGLLAIGGSDLAVADDLLRQAQARGLITSEQEVAIRRQASDGMISWGQVVADMSAKLDTYNKFTTDLVSAAPAVATGFANQTYAAVAAAEGYQAETAAVRNSSDAIRDHAAAANSLIAAAEGFKAEQAAIQNNTDAIRDHTAALGEMDTKQQKANETSALAAGMAGKLTAAEAAYSGVVEADAPKLAKLQDELAKYTDAQGKAYTATTDSKYSLDQVTLANDKISIASERLTIAQQHLAEAHQGAKESAEAYATRLLSLQVAVQSAGDSVMAANDNVDKMAKGMGSSTSGVADYTTKIAALKAQIDPLVDAENKAHDAIVKTTDQMIYQAVAADLPIAAQKALALKLGLVSQADYNLVVAAEAIIQKYHDGLIPLDEMNAELDALAQRTVAATDVIPPMTTNLGEVKKTAAYDARTAFSDLKAAEDALYSKLITITTHHVDTYSTNTTGSGQESAGGADFIVPPGYPNDSYPMLVESGEHVVVTPAGQRGGGGRSAPSASAPAAGGIQITNIINDKLALALQHEHERQLALARHEALM